ncbi:MAG: hypothetical protein CMI02_07405 [Oceanospirillaceae bacterium]|nr:hypothetical protein [Oceanospirillaceae bacterium]
MKTDSDKLTRLVRYFEETEYNTQEARQNAERDRDYFDGHQWSADEIAELKRRKQPVIVINRIRRLINFLKGLESQGATDPKAFPRTPKDEGGAHAATDALRYVEEKENLDAKLEKCWEEFLIEGSCAVEVTVEPRGNDYDIVVKRWAWDRSFIDIHSKEPGGSDARFMGGVIWMDLDEAEERWTKAADAFATMMNEGTLSDTFDDKPAHAIWADPVRKRVRVVQMYYQERGKWHWCLFTKSTELESGEVPYVDQDGDSENPMKYASAYIDRENRRYGAVRDMISPQDEINKRRSKLLHQLNMRQTLGEQGAVKDIVRMKSELAKPDGHVTINPNMRFELVQNNDQIAGQAQLLQEAKGEIDGMGPNAALAGRGTEDQSGRAIVAQQQGGLVEIAPLRNQFLAFKREIYRAIWNRVKQYWTAEKWIRVTDDENAPRFVGLNVPVTRGQVELAQLQQMGVTGDALQRAQMIAQYAPEMQQVLGVENNVTELDVDIIIEATPDTVTAAQEQFDTLARLAEGGVPIPPNVLIEAAPGLRNKERLLEMMSGGDNPEAAQKQQVAEQLQFADAEAEVRKKNASAMKDEATAAEKMAQPIYQ